MAENIFEENRGEKVIKYYLGPRQNIIEFDQNKTLLAFYDHIFLRDFAGLGNTSNDVLENAIIRSPPPSRHPLANYFGRTIYQAYQELNMQSIYFPSPQGS